MPSTGKGTESWPCQVAVGKNSQREALHTVSHYSSVLAVNITHLPTAMPLLVQNIFLPGYEIFNHRHAYFHFAGFRMWICAFSLNVRVPSSG